MRLICTAIMLCFALVGCTTTPGDDTVAKAQAFAKAACSFLPTAETVADIIKVGDLTTAKAVAAAICNAINPDTPAGVMTLLSKGPAKVDGVVIRGKHIE